MSIDLTLLLLIGEDYWAAHSMLDLRQRGELWPEINCLPQIDIPQPLNCYMGTMPNGERGYGETLTDSYGDHLKWVTAADLLTLKDHEAIQDNWKNSAIWEYLTQMPPQWKIVLYWH